VIREELKLVTTGTAGVNALADALERAAAAQARLGSGGSGRGGSSAAVASRVDEINARGAAQFQLRQQSAIAGVVSERVRQEGEAAKGAVAIRQKELALAQEQVRADVRREAIAERAAARAEKNARAQARAMGRRPSTAAAAGQVTDSGMTLTDLKSALDIATAIGSRLATVAYSAGSALIQAQAFREDVRRGLETVLRSKSEAEKAFSTATATADFIGRGRAEVTGDFLDLLTKGFSTAKTDEITRRLADLATVDPRANQSGIVRAIGQIAGKGRLQGDELLQLAEAGLETKSVYEALSKTLDKTTPELVKLQAAGKITSDVAVEAILEAIKTQTGGKGAGVAANEKSMNDLSSLIDRVKSIPANVLFDLDAGPGLEKTKTSLREIIAFFDASSASGQEVRKVLGDTFNALAEELFGIDASGGVTQTLQGIVDTIRDSKEDIRDFAAGMRTVASAIGFVLRLLPAFQKVANGDSGGLVASILGDSVVGSIKTSLDHAFAAIAEAPARLFAAGANLMSSLGAGITSTAQAVIDAVTSTVGGAIAWAKKLLGIASPSRVFMEIGGYTSAGFVAGIASNDNAVANASAAMARAAVGGAAGAAFPAAGGAGAVAAGASAAAAGQGGASAGPSIVVTIERIVVSGARSDAEAASQGEAAAAAFEAQLRRSLPRLLREMAA
jgi:tape measure domain-containing protein